MRKSHRERRKEQRANLPPKPPAPTPPPPTPDPPKRASRALLWIVSVVLTAFVGGGIAVWLDKHYEPRLEVVHIPGVHMELKVVESAVRRSARFDLFEGRPEFKNHGLREGSIARCEVEPWRTYLSPKVEITHIDTTAIPRGATEKRNIQFRAVYPNNPAPYELLWSIGCWDTAGNRTGTMYTVYYPHGEKKTAAGPPK